MNIKIGKEYRWEMGHRLLDHEGGCVNVHGHSYKMMIELEGSTNENSMIMDYYEMDKLVNPVIEKLDHSFVCHEEDKDLIEFLENKGYKYNVISGESTVENLVSMFAGEFTLTFRKYENIKKLTVRIYETEDAFAEISVDLF